VGYILQNEYKIIFIVPLTAIWRIISLKPLTAIWRIISLKDTF